VEASLRVNEDRLTKILLGIAGLLFLLVIGLGAYFLGRQTAPEAKPAANAGVSATKSEFDYKVLNEIRAYLDRYYVRPENLDDETLFTAAINGMLEVLNDYGTSYMDPRDHKLDTTISGSFEGIGVTIAVNNGEIVIVAPIKNTPAEKAGLNTGDVIVAVDGEPTKGWTAEQAQLRIRGERGTPVTITIRHPDNSQQDYKLTRATVEVPSVNVVLPSELKDGSGAVTGNIGYIQISSFSIKTAQELDKAIKDQLAAGAKGLVVDVRSNLGGLRDTAISAVDLFLNSGTIVIQRDRDGSETNFRAKQGDATGGMPIVVLQNKWSASAAEILSAALRDNGRATIVGETSFGKGTVNQSQNLSNGGALFVSVADWLTPGGARIDHVGVIPDVEIRLTDEDLDQRRDAQLFGAIEVLRAKLPK
jgi:carboxyl-terminal processing protease